MAAWHNCSEYATLVFDFRSARKNNSVDRIHLEEQNSQVNKECSW